MKKEIIFAIIIGILLGLAITYGIYTSKNSQRNSQQTSVNETIISDSNNANVNQLAIHEPLEGDVVNKETITIAGTSLANNFIIIFVGDEETITQADESGNFSTTIDLESGGNILTIYAIDENGQQSQIEKSVILDDSSTQLNTEEEASSSAETEETDNEEEDS